MKWKYCVVVYRGGVEGRQSISEIHPVADADGALVAINDLIYMGD